MRCIAEVADRLAPEIGLRHFSFFFFFVREGCACFDVKERWEKGGMHCRQLGEEGEESRTKRTHTK